MKIQKVTARNIMGLAHFEFTPEEGFNEISGRNGSGKTSVLEAIKAATGGAVDATLLRSGETEGEIVLVLDDNSTKIRKTITASGSKTAIQRDGKAVSRPGEAMRALTDVMSVNPVSFLKAEKKDRVKVLLESMPLFADNDAITERAGFKVNFPEGTHALIAIASVHAQIFEQRTGTNRAIKEKEGTISQLREAIPDAPGGVEGDEADMTSRLDTSTAAHDAQRKRIADHLESLNAKHQTAVEQLRTEAGNRIQALRDQIATIQTESDAAIAAERTSISEKRQRAADANATNDKTLADARQPLDLALAAIRSNRDVAAKRQANLDLVAQMVDQAAELQEEADGQTEALTKLDAYKSELLDSLPIPGLEVRDGEVYRHGVHLDRLNTAQQVEIAVEVAKLRAGELGVICVDGIELMDSDNYNELKKQAEASGFQFFVTRVDDGDFTLNP
jgi:DNA repair exonuclease SbcCD ATPase subunit